MSRTDRIMLVTTLALTGVVLLSSGCLALHQPQAADARQPKEVRLTESEGVCGSGVGLNVGDTLEVVMDSKLEGYVWDIGFNVPAVLKVTEQPTHDPSSGPGGTETFHLEAVAEGQDVLRLFYHAPTNDTGSQSRICEVQVTVAE